MCLRLVTHKLAVGPADGDGLVSHSGAAPPAQHQLSWSRQLLGFLVH